MYKGDKSKSSSNWWYDYSMEDQERLFFLLKPLIRDMILEVLMEIQIDIETKINGSPENLSGLRADIEKIIYEKLNEK